MTEADHDVDYDDFDHYLSDVLDAVRAKDDGEVLEVPRQLAEADPELLAIGLCTVEGEVHSAGDDDHAFTIQSVSKAFAYALACEDHGIEAVLEKVDVEPSGEAYNVISVEPGSKRPRNPMINAGAMTIHALVHGVESSNEERIEVLLDRFSTMAGRRLEVDEDAFEDEFRQTHRNLAIAHMLRAEGVMPDDPVDVVRGYTKQCSILVTVRDLAAMAGTLATGGRQPITGERVVSHEVARHTLSVMATCGMYDSAGDWLSDIGIPAKSGVSGSITGAIPGRAGLAVYSPRLDQHGTSVRGQLALDRLTEQLGLHVFDDPLREDTLWRRLCDKAERERVVG